MEVQTNQSNPQNAKELLPTTIADASVSVANPKIRRRNTVLTRVDKKLRDEMKHIAYRDGTTMSKMNDEALRDYLEYRSELTASENE